MSHCVRHDEHSSERRRGKIGGEAAYLPPSLDVNSWQSFHEAKREISIVTEALSFRGSEATENPEGLGKAKTQTANRPKHMVGKPH